MTPSAFRKIQASAAFQLDYGDFEQMVNEAWPALKGEYEFPCYEETGNDVSKRYSVHPLDMDSGMWEYQKEDLAGITAGETVCAHGNAALMLNALCTVGAIPAGTYNIHVSW